jgi:hypothetical protein
MLLPVTSTARTSSVSSSIPICILCQTRRLEPPCLRAFHAPSPSALMPVLSISRLSGPVEPRYGRLTFNVFWRRHKVLKSGVAWSSPIRPTAAGSGRTSCLAKRHAKQDFQRQAGLNGGITELLLPTSIIAWRRCPNHLRIKPYRQRSTLLQAVIVR